MGMIPEGMKWQEWFSIGKNTGFLISDPHKRGINAFDAQFSGAAEVTRMEDLAVKVQMLEVIRQNLGRVMYFNDVRLGETSPYSNQKNTEANEVASYKQTSLFFTQHNEVVEEVLQAFLNYARMYYKDHPEEAEVFLDDVSLAELIVGPDISYHKLGITLHNSPQTIKKLNILKQQTLSFIQNPEALANGVIPLVLADTEQEIIEIADKQNADFQKRRQEDMQYQMQLQQAQIDRELQKEQMKQDREDKRENSKLRSQEMRALLDSTKYAKQADIDQNMINDAIQKAALEAHSREKIELAKIQSKEKIEGAKLLRDSVKLKNDKEIAKESNKIAVKNNKLNNNKKK